MSNVSNAGQAWGPGVIGLTISLSMYGISLGQYFFYYRAFPKDTRLIKVMVALVFAMDTFHTYTTAAIYWIFLIFCRRSPSCALILPWQMTAAIIANFAITMVVQLFYGYRIWIISQKNLKLTAVVFVLAVGQFVMGILCAILGATGSATKLYDSPFAPIPPLISVICDIIIACSIVFYLRAKRSGIRRTETLIQKIMVVSVQMGVLTCGVSLFVVILYPIQHGGYLLAAPTVILCKSYVNSFLAILNARKAARGNQVTILNTLEIPTIWNSNSSS